LRYLITGCNSDIGKVLTKRLTAQPNSQVLLVSRSDPTESAEGEHSLIKRVGGLDLTNAAHLEKLACEVTAFFDGPFSTIHSVGDFWRHRPLDECSILDAEKMYRSHYLTLYGVIHSLIPTMRSIGGGKFIAFSCNSVVYNYPEMAAFTSAKAAVECLIKCVANEYSGEGVQANVLALPTIRTQKVEKDKPQGDLGNYIRPEELASIIIEQVETLSEYINGNVIRVFRHSDSFYHEAYFMRNPSGSSKKG